MDEIITNAQLESRVIYNSLRLFEECNRYGDLESSVVVKYVPL